MGVAVVQAIYSRDMTVITDQTSEYMHDTLGINRCFDIGTMTIFKKL